jgi:hypothetical protein
MAELTESEVLQLIAEASTDGKSEAEIFVDALAARTQDVPEQLVQPEPTRIERGGQTLIKNTLGQWVELPSVTTAELHHGHVTPETRAEITAAEENRKKQIVQNVKQLKLDAEEAYFRKLVESEQPPVTISGRQDHGFFEQLKAWIVPKADGTPDWRKTYAAHQLAYRGYENKKSAKPGRTLAAVDPDEYSKAISEIINPQVPEAKNNRYVRG